jgi:hypothetical protein
MRQLFLIVFLVLAGCTVPPPTALPSPTDTFVPTRAPTPTAPATGLWLPFFAGAEVLETADGFTAVRHSPSTVTYDSDFEHDPEQGKQVGEWLDMDEQALVAVNCGFYWEKNGAYQHMGLLMVNGEGWSELRSNWGGVLIVRDGQAFIAPRPQRLLAPATLGLQGWPMLVQNQTVVSQLDDQDLGRRTAVGIDAQGRVVWVVATDAVTLADFARRLLETDLGLTMAVNLDGGVSSGLRWRAGVEEPQVGPNSLPVPCAIRFGPIG